MQKLKCFAIALALLIGIGGVETFAQTRKKIVKKKPTIQKTAKSTTTKPNTTKQTTVTTTTTEVTTLGNTGTSVMPTNTAVNNLYTVDQGKVFKVRINNGLSSKSAKIGDLFTVSTIEPIYSSTGQTLIPMGSTIIGKITAVNTAERKGKPGNFETSFFLVEVPNGNKYLINGELTSLDTQTAKSDNEGIASGDKMNNRKIILIGGGAGTGAAVGGVAGGAKGAAIGGAAGAGAGIVADQMLKGEEASIKPGTEFGILLNQPITLPKFVEK